MAKDGSNSWYENALLLAVAGSIIAFMGQLAGTVIPIMYGPEDASDFSIGVNPVNFKVYSENGTMNVGNVSVADFHHRLRPYRFGVFLRALGAPENAKISFSPGEIRPGEVSKMAITFGSSLVYGEYPITIQGMGGDGKIRNTTFILSCMANKSVSRDKIGFSYMAFN